jgi:hypothetical protein
VDSNGRGKGFAGVLMSVLSPHNKDNNIFSILSQKYIIMILLSMIIYWYSGTVQYDTVSLRL